MFVCICENITCKDIRNAVDEGATSVRDLNSQMALGSQCGKCVCTARKVIKEHLDEQVFELAIPA